MVAAGKKSGQNATDRDANPDMTQHLIRTGGMALAGLRA